MEIPLEQLSKTILDAIRLTRELGERFLWVDSLCIVQDDPGDLEAQIGLMGAIFEGAYCMIAATDAKGIDGSSDTDLGLFHSKPQCFKTACLRAREGDGSLPSGTHEIFIHEDPRPFGLREKLRQKAWYSRGWVYQERELSRRCIFFTQETVGWRCNLYWETEQTGVPERREARTKFNLDEPTEVGDDDNYDTKHRVRRLWQASVEDYSTTKLSYGFDKNKALQGMMERLGARYGATFHFGILDMGSKEDLCRQLLWMPKMHHDSSSESDFDFTCPTWSWMIMSRPVTWTFDDHTHSEPLSEVRFGHVRGDSQQLHISGLGRVIRVGTPIGDIPRFSQYERWALDTHFGWSEAGLALDSSAKAVLSDVGNTIGWVLFDTLNEVVKITAVSVQQYFRLDEEEPLCVEFLALAEVPGKEDPLLPNGPDKYRRVGRGRVLVGSFDWLEVCEPYNIIVV